jgi:GNAT superfamily N-acetyltransferase
VELDKLQHERAAFDCGEPELNDFLHTKAVKHMEVGVSRTMVLPATVPLPSGKLPICTFYSIAPGSISRETLPPALAKKLPRYPIPIFLLAELGVHQEYHGQGLGKITLLHALTYFVEINVHMRAYAIMVDCLDETAEGFYTKYGFEFLYELNGRKRLFMPMSTVSQLF